MRCLILVLSACLCWSGLTFGQTSLLDDETVDLPDLNLDKNGGINLSLDDCVRIAVRAASSILKAQNVVYTSGAALLQSYAQFLPNLTGQADSAKTSGTEYFTQATPALVQGSASTAGYSVSTDLNIFNGLSDLAHLKSAVLKKSASELSLHRAKQAIALDATQSFLTVILDDRLVKIARKNLQESQAREKLLEEQTRVGAKNLADLFRQKAQVSADESLLLTSENKQRTDEIRLLQRLRVDVMKSYHFVDFQFGPEKSDERYGDEKNLVKTGLSNRADLKATNELADASHWDVKSAWSGYLPKLDLQAGLAAASGYLYNQNVNGVYSVPPSQTPLYTQLGSQIEYSIGLYLTWTLFDRLVTQASVAQARATASNADIDAVDAKNQVQADVRLAYSNYKTALQQLRASREGLAAAQKAYDVIEGRYEVGSANFIDLITAQATLLQAESTRAQAQINFTLQGKAVEFSTGEMKVN